MKKWICLMLTLAIALCAPLACAQTLFEDACALLAEAAKGENQVYVLYESGLDTVDAVGGGTLSVDQALEKLRACVGDLRAMQTATLNPSQTLKDYMLERGLLLEDFQAVANGATLTAGYYADNLDSFISTWEASPTLPSISTTLLRAGMEFERKMDFVATNSILLPETDEETEIINRVLVEKTDYLSVTRLPWESDLNVCLAKYDALEAEYEDLLKQASVNVDEQEAALDQAQ